MSTHPRDVIYLELEAERLGQDRKWGEQNHPDGTGSSFFAGMAYKLRRACERAFERREGTWAHIFREEVYEALAESDEARLRAELLQVAAVAVAWVEALDRRGYGVAACDRDSDGRPHGF